MKSYKKPKTTLATLGQQRKLLWHFQVEDADKVSAQEFAEQCICAGKERIVLVIESA